MVKPLGAHHTCRFVASPDTESSNIDRYPLYQKVRRALLFRLRREIISRLVSFISLLYIVPGSIFSQIIIYSYDNVVRIARSYLFFYLYIVRS